MESMRDDLPFTTSTTLEPVHALDVGPTQPVAGPAAIHPSLNRVGGSSECILTPPKKYILTNTKKRLIMTGVTKRRAISPLVPTTNEKLDMLYDLTTRHLEFIRVA